MYTVYLGKITLKVEPTPCWEVTSYTTAELCDQSLGDSQSQADSIGPLRQLDKTIENPFQLVVRDSLACIRHIKADFLLRHVIPEANITFFRVLDSIRQ